MPVLRKGAKGGAVPDLQTVLRNGSGDGTWPSPGETDGDFGSGTEKSVEGLQKWGDVDVDGTVGDQTWAVSLHATSATLETAVGLKWAEE